MTSHTWSFSGLTSPDGSLAFSSINATEQDTGYFSAFFGEPNPTGNVYDGLQGMQWSGYRFGVFGPSSSITVNLNYDVTAIPSEQINSVTQFYNVDEFTGLGVGASATETVYNMSGQVLGSTTWVATGTGAASSTVVLSQPAQQVYVTVTLNESISALGSLLKSDVDISIVGQYFGESAAPGSISSYVYCDSTGSGVYQSGDMLMSGVTVQLYNSVGTLVGSTVTGSNGAYTFTNLAAGTYTTKVIAPAGDNISTSNNGVDTVILTAGEADNAAPTGLDMPGVWTTDVFYQSGSLDIGLPGVAVALENSGGTVVSSGITGLTGAITFNNLTVGSTYEVVVTTPAGDMVVSSTNVATPDEVLSCGTITSTETVTAIPITSFTPGVEIVKSVTSVGGVTGDPAATYAGEAIDYQVVVTNIGNETLTDVVVTDPTLGTTLASLASLAVNATVTYTVATTVTQAEIDSGKAVPNTAVVTDDQTPSQTSSVSTPVSQSAAVTIVKSVTAVGGINGDPAATYAGEEIQYQVVVANTGNETLTNVVVTDPTLGQTLGTLASLAVGASVVYVAEQAVTQAEIDSGNVVPNTAVVTDTQTPSQTSSVSTPVSQSAAVTIVKSVTAVGGINGDPAATYAGEEIQYQVVVANTGNETLTNVVVTDPTLGQTLGTLASLAVGASVVYVAEQAVTQAEIDSGNVVPNTAVVTDTQTPSQSSSVSTPVSQSPAIAIDEQVVVNGQTFEAGNGVLSPYPTVVAGSTLTEQDIVTNTGNVTLTDVVVTDSQGQTFTVPGTLAVGASYTIAPSETVTASNDILSTDSASVSGVGNGTTVTASDRVDYTGALPAISIDEQVVVNGQTFEAGNGVLSPYPTVVAGSTLTEQDIVTNTGTVALTDVVVTDSQGNTFTVGSLAVGASYTIAPSETVTAGNNIVSTDSASVSGVYDDNFGNSATVTASDRVDYTGALPAISIDEQVVVNGQTFEAGNGVLSPYPTVVAGSTLTEQDIVTNTGTVALTDVVVTDSQGNTFTVGSLAVGASYTIAPSETVTAGNNIVSTDSASVSGVYDDNFGNSATVTASDRVDYTGALPAISIDEQVVVNGQTFEAGNGVLSPYPTVVAGSTLTEQDIVTNTGTVALTDVVVTDSQGNTFTVPGTLAVGASYTIAPSETVTAGNNILSTDSASVSGVYDDNFGNSATVTASDRVDYTGALPAISIDEQVVVNGQTFEAGNGVLSPYPTVVAGSTLTEQDIVTNTGTVALTDVVVTDSQGHTFTVPGTLAVGASYTIAPSETVTAGNNILSTDSASVSGVYDDNYGNSATVTASDSVDYRGVSSPAVSIVKTVTSVGGVSGDPAATYAGEVIDYQVVVSNTGNETLTDVVVTDPTLGTTLGSLASLAVGASVTYTTSQTVTQAELDGTVNIPASGLPNTATVTDDQTPSQSSTVSTVLTHNSDETVVKSVTSVGGVAGNPAATYAGETIDYQVVVTNTGNETLTNLVVTDPTLGMTLGTLASLAVGTSVVYTASTTVTQAEIDAGGPIFNTAVATDTQIPAYSSSVSTPVQQSPSDAIIKTVTSVGGVAGDPAVTYAGEVIDYQIVASNTGNMTLTDVVVTDQTLGITLGSLASLAVGASVTYTLTDTVTQGTIDQGGSVIDVAQISAQFVPPTTSSVTTPISQSPGISIVKSVTSVGGVAGDPAATYAGEVIDYKVVITNTGNETLTNVVVTDPTLGTTLGTLGFFAVGTAATYIASRTVTQAEIDSGNSVPNKAVVTDSQTPSQTSTVSTPVSQSPSVTIVKSVTSVGGVNGDPAATYAGEVVDYKVVVSNTGNETLTNVVVTDPTLGTTLASLASLAVGGSITYTAAQTVTQAEIDSGNTVPNTAVVTDTQTPSQTSSVSTPVSQSPAVTIVKSVTSVGGVNGDPAATYAGEVIDYKVVVSNTGNETLTNVVVTDPTLGTTLASLASLAVGGSVTYTAAQTVTQAEINAGGSVPNTAVVTDTQTPSQTSSVSTPVSQSPTVTIVKSVTSVGGVNGDPTATYAGEVIDYKVVVSNTGNETLTNVVVTDPTLGTTLGSLASLAVGGSVTYTAAQTVTQAEINAGGSVPNTAVVTDTQTPSQTSSVSTPVSQSPAVTIVKSVTSVGGVNGDPAATYAGEVIDYKVVVSNTGNETLTNVVVTDPTLGTTLGSLVSLAVGGSVTYTAAQTVTQAEIDSGNTVPNTAVVTDTQTPSQTSAVSTPVSQSPAVTIVKSVTSVGGVNGDPAATYAGEVIDYKVVVTNTGNETLTNVQVTDSTLGTTLGSLASLAVGGSVTYTAAQTVTQAEIDSGKTVPNTAVVTDSQTPSQSSTVTTPVSDSPAVAIVKSVTSVGGASGDPAATYAGELIDYKVVVTNTGDETLTNVLVTDTTLGTTLGSLASLAVGANVTYTAVQTVTQAEINAGGSVPNIALVTDSQTPSQTSSVTTPVSQSPGVSIVKTVASVGGVSGDPAATYAGEVIDYQVVVTNTGNEALTNVLVTDATLGTTLGSLASLAVGGIVTYTAAQTVTSAELSSGKAVPNTAMVTDSQTPSQTSTVTTPVSQSPGISIVKTVTSVGGVSGDPAATYAGEVIDYNIVVTNTGAETLTNVVVKDTTLGTTLGTIATLAAGASVTYTAAQTVSQADLNQVLGTSAGTGGCVTHTTPSSGLGSGCVAWLSSSFNPTSCANGATYSFSGITCTISGSGVGGSLVEQCANAVVTFSNSCTQATTTFNSATNCWVTTLPANCSPGSIFLSGLPFTVPSGCNLNNCSVTWSIGSSSNNCGSSSIGWDGSCVAFNNFNQSGCNGLSDYNNIGVQSCDNLGCLSEYGYSSIAGTPLNQFNANNCNLLDCAQPTGGCSCGSTGTVTCTTPPTNVSGTSVINTATVTDTQGVTGSSTVSTTVAYAPSLSIVKTVTSVGGCAGDPSATYAGEAIDYRIVVTNTGDEALTNVLVTDTTLGTTLGTIASLAVGAAATYTAVQTVTQAEINNNSAILNTATVTDAQTPSQTSTVSTTVSQAPGVSIVKTVTSVGGVSGDPTATYAGELIDYKVVVTNTGNETLTNVLVTDQTLGTTLGTLASLAVGAGVTYTAVQTVTSAEISAHNSIPNTAVVTDSQTPSQASTVTTQVAQSPSVSIVKTVTSVGGVSGDPSATYAGEVIDYKIVVTNTGSETLTNVVVKDTTLGTTLGTLASLAAGASITYTAAQTVSQADLNQVLGSTTGCGGSVTHSASGSGLGSGCTAWLSSSFNPTSCANGATYSFSGITCTISGAGAGGSPFVEQCPNAVITFSSSCTQATTTFNSTTNCWVTTLPANCSPGSIFLSGLPFAVPSGCNLSNCNITWSIGQSSNNCGASSVSWDTTCAGFNSFNESGCNGLTNYNNIGVQSCDNLGGYDFGSYNTCAGTPLNQYTYGNCSNDCFLQNCSDYSNSCDGGGTCVCTPAPTNVVGSAVINTATVTDSQNVTGSSTASTTVTGSPGVSIVKSVTSVGGVSGDPAATYAGEVIDYKILVTNTGNETLTNVLVTDTTLGTTLGTIASLAAGASVTYTAAQTVTSAEMSNGSPISNTATVTDAQTPSQSSTVSTTVTHPPAVSIVKTVTSVGGVSGDPSATYAGEVIDYKVVVTNTGGTTLTNVVVKDSTLGTTLGTLASLAVGASVTYTAAQTVSQADLNQILGTTTGSGGSVTHSAGSGFGSGCTAWLSSTFNPTSCADGATYTFTGITCTISGSGVGGSLIEQCANAVITFSNSCTQATTTFDSSSNCWVTTLPANCSPGSVFLSGLPFTVPSGCNLSNCNITWSIGQSSNNCGSSNLGWDTTCTAFNNFSQNGCNGLSDYNQIGVQSCDNLGGYSYGYDSTCAGTPLNQYSYGNCGAGCFIQYGNNNSCGDSGTLSCTPPQSNVSGSSVINTATVTDSQGVTGSSTVSTAVTGVPHVTIVKTVTSVGGCSGDPSATYAGEVIDYQIVVTNTGDEALTNLVVTDATLGTTLGTITSLAAGASLTYTEAMAVTQAEINSGSTITNTASVTDSQAVSSSSTASTSVSQLPGISIANSVTSVNGVAGDPVATKAGEVIDYKIVVTNTGNETLTNVLVKDTTLGTTLGTLASLAVGATVTYTATQTVTSAELSNCAPVSNTATVTDSQTAVQSSTATTEVTQISGVTIGGTAPTGSLSSTYGTAQQIEFTYNPSDTVSLKQIQSGLASESGNNTNSMAFLEISNSSNPYASNASIYYEGTVQAGQEIYANATYNPITNTAVSSPNNHFSTANGADIYAYIFTSQTAFQSGASPIQTMVYNTSGSQAMHLGDQIGSLTVAGYIGANGGHVTA